MNVWPFCSRCLSFFNASRLPLLRGGYRSMTSIPMVLAAWFTQVWFGEPTANHGDHAFFDRDRAKTGDPRPTVWEKSFQTRLSWRFRKKSGNHAKTRDSRTAWEKHLGNRLSWRSRFFAMALLPKPATGFGEIPMGNGLSWRLSQKKRSLRQNRRPLTRDLGKIFWKPFILAIAKPSAIR